MALIGGMVGYAERSVVPSGSGIGAPPQVQNLLLDLQGQTSSNSTGSPPTPPFPNQQKIVWDAASTATGYNIYRSIDGGSFSLYDTSAVTNYTDLAATNCVNGTAGAGPDYYVSTVYRYKIAGTNASGEGAQSATQSCIYYANGVQDHMGGDFNTGCTSDYANATGSPLGGHTLCLKNTTTGGFGDWLPWAGNNATKWNLPVGPYNYFQLDVKAMQASSSLQFHPLRVGDVEILAQGGGTLTIQSSDYATLVNGTWVTVKVPLSVLLKDWTSGSGVQQHAWYKCNIQDTSASSGQVYFIDNVLFVP